MARRDYSKGMHWIGHAGSLVPVTDFGTTATVDELEPVVQTGMGGGRRVRVPRGRAPRSWQMSIPAAHADDVSHVRTLTASTMPPYVLVTAEAQVSNVLTPERSTLQEASRELALGGWWPLAGQRQGGGVMARLNPSAAFGAAAPVHINPAPVPPLWTGRPVTISVHVATAREEGAQLGLRWYDVAGANVGSTIWSDPSESGMDGLRRITVTGRPPAGAAACGLIVYYAEVLAQAQVTWTDAPIPEWSLGNGADMVVPTASSRETDLAVPGDYALRRGDYEFAFTEVGP